jgi:nucleoside-diphosphate-sugar epimerase
MNILITGSTGFIGYSLTKRLKAQKHSVRCLVRDKRRTEKLLTLGVELIEGDLLIPESLRSIVKGVDIVYHLAGTVYTRKTNEFYKGNVEATKNLIDACKGKSIKRFVFVSSVAVYQPPKDKVVLIEDATCKPITSYGRSKLQAEQLVLDSGIPAVIVRGPVIYGPNGPKPLNDFLLKIINSGKAVIIGDGKNYRSLCYIDNFVDGLLLVGEKEQSIGRIYNISDETIYTFNDIIQVTSAILGINIKIVRFPRIISAIAWSGCKFMERIFGFYYIELYSIKTMTLNLGCDISRIKKEIGYESRVSLRDGLTETLEWLKRVQ